MPAVAVRYKGYRNEVIEETPKELLAKAEADPFFIYPYEILCSMLDDEERPGGVSVTGLLDVGKCLRCTILDKYEEYTLDLEKKWLSWRGTMFHRTIERYARAGAVSEIRFWAKLPSGEELHGKPDLIVLDALVDLKNTENIPRWDNPWPDHVDQLQVYRWLVNNACKWEGSLGGWDPNKWECARLGIWYADPTQPMGFKPIEIRKAVPTPTKKGAANPYKNVKVPDIWSDKKVLAFIEPRYAAVSQAFEDYERYGILPPYPPGFNYLTNWIHRYRPTAELCVERYIEERSTSLGERKQTA